MGKAERDERRKKRKRSEKAKIKEQKRKRRRKEKRSTSGQRLRKVLFKSRDLGGLHEALMSFELIRRVSFLAFGIKKIPERKRETERQVAKEREKESEKERKRVARYRA